MLKLEDSLSERLRAFSRDEGLHVLLPAGIGDTLWAMTKLRGLAMQRRRQGQRVTFWLPEGEQQRAGDYLKMLGVNVDYLPHLTTRWVWDRPGAPAIPKSGWFAAHANRTLEQGRRIETWYPDLPISYPRPKIKATDRCRRAFVLCFTCTRRYMMGQLPPFDWREMVAKIETTVAPVRFVGAAADVEFINEIRANARYGQADHLLDLPFENVLAAMRSKYCRGMFGVAGGPIIAATVEGVRSWFFYPRHLADMPGTWEPEYATWNHCLVSEATGAVRGGDVGKFLLTGEKSRFVPAPIAHPPAPVLQL